MIKRPEKLDIKSAILKSSMENSNNNKINFLINSPKSKYIKEEEITEIQKSNVLFVENISKEATKNYLEDIFIKFSGFKKIKTYINNYCVVEFDEISNAELFFESMNGKNILDRNIKISYSSN